VSTGIGVALGLIALSSGCKIGEPPPPVGVVPLEVGRVVILPIGPTSVLTLAAGTSAQLSIRVLDSRGNSYLPAPTVTFATRDSSVATVSPAGAVTAVGTGSTFIEAQVTGAYYIYPDSVAVNVVISGASK
jgi:Big-like domain-containing protein